MDLMQTFIRLGVVLGLGLLVGLQRERTESQLAGIRTFPLIAVLGAMAALLSGMVGGWIVAAGLLGLAGLIVAANLLRLKIGSTDPGMTTEVAAVLMYAVGAYTMLGHLGVGIAVGGGVAVLLYWKEPLHRWAGQIGESDVRAIMRFVLIALVVLPALPNRTFDPYQVLNPFKLWLLVVLVVGISLAGYLAYKLLGSRGGAVLGGVLGGLISSTATTVSYARQSRAQPAMVPVAALVVMIASTIALVRVVVLIGAAGPAHFADMAWPVAALAAVMAVLSLPLWWMMRRAAETPAAVTQHGNPSELRPAIIFAVLFAVVLLAVAAARRHLGDQALYAIAALAGLTDMDAITLSTTQMVNGGKIEAATGWRLILVAAMSNLVFKGGAVALLGQRRLVLYVAVLFGLTLLAGAALLSWWPT